MYVMVILFVELFMEDFITSCYKIKCVDGNLYSKESWKLRFRNKCTTTIQINTRTNVLNDCFEDIEIF